MSESRPKLQRLRDFEWRLIIYSVLLMLQKEIGEKRTIYLKCVTDRHVLILLRMGNGLYVIFSNGGLKDEIPKSSPQRKEGINQPVT